VNTTPPTAPSSTAADVTEIEAAIQGHWNAVDSGNYTDAYSYFSPNERSKNPESSWLNDKNVDQPRIVDPITFGSIYVHGTTAEAYVHFSTVGQEGATTASGCRRTWSNYYAMAKVDGRWLIDGSKLTKASYGCSS
jgi:hypothetical protein